MAAQYLNLNGIPTDAPPGDRVFFYFDPQGVWRRSQGDRSSEFDFLCVRLHDALRKRIMEGKGYEQLIYSLPQFVQTVGLNSEGLGGAAQFEQSLKTCKDFPHLNAFLYLYDCQKLVGSIQECNKEVDQLLGEFYKTLNTEPMFYPPFRQEDGIRFNTSPTVTKLFAHLSFIFIRLHSLLDYSAKVAAEVDKLRSEFTKYPKLASANILFGDRKKLSLNNAAGTVFEASDLVTTVETLRNHIIHDGLLDDMPKGYEDIRGGVAIERFLLMPDMTAGRFDRFNNRNLFFGQEDKINLRLPALIDAFQTRMEATVEALIVKVG